MSTVTERATGVARSFARFFARSFARFLAGGALICGLAGCDEAADPSAADADATADAPAAATPTPGAAAFALVDPFIGTGGDGYGVGSALPGATMPFSMVKLSPDTANGSGGVATFMHCGGYAYSDKLVLGFSHTHMHGIGVPAYGNVLFMPTRGFDPSKRQTEGYRSPFDHASEVAEPGYYAVTLQASGVRAEVTVGPRTGVHRWTWPAGTASDDAVLIVDLGYAIAQGKVIDGHVELLPGERRVRGWTRADGMHGGVVRVFFDARFDHDFHAVGAWTDGQPVAAPAGATRVEADGTLVGAFVAFDLGDGASPGGASPGGASPGGASPGDASPGGAALRVVEAQVGISYVDAAGAAGNLAADLVADFAAARGRARTAWQDALAQVDVEGGSDDQRGLFYSALYHALQHPTLVSDHDGRYRGLDGATHAGDRPYYTDFSLWDTYRTLHPLLILIAPQRAADMAQSLVLMAEQWGGLPRWPLADGDSGSMIGTSADVVLAETWLKGIDDFDIQTAWKHMVAHADGPVAQGGRDGVQAYIDKGYVPSDQHSGAVSKTLEYAWDDFALANLAAALGKSDDAARLRARSRRIGEMWEPASGYFRGRLADGGWEPEFTDTGWHSYYVEGNAWQHLWLTPYVDVLSELMGGDAAVVARLDELFTLSKADWDETDGTRWLPLPYYWHGNEPDLIAPWLYIDAGAPAKAQRWVRWVMDEHYGPGPKGLAGNDDAGTLSAWYIFAALGVYPIAGGERYYVGAPLFPRVVLHLDGGDLTVVRAGGAGPYVASARLDGEDLLAATILHPQLVGATELRVEVAAEPTSWGTAARP